MGLQVSAIATAQDIPEYREHVVVVQFESSLQIVAKASRTGLVGFDQTASRLQIHAIERVYPFLDHVEPTATTRQNLLALRRTYYVHFDADEDPAEVAKSLSGVPAVVYAEPIPIHRLQVEDPASQVSPNDPLYIFQAELKRLRLPEAWEEVKSESGDPIVVIAIVDGGGEWRHEDLRANVWTNEDEIPGNGIDDDNNGFIDDRHGVDFPDPDGTDNDPTRAPGIPGISWHGTATAGAVGAVSNNSIGIAGASWNASIMHINAAHVTGFGIGFGYEGILYAAANGADIINASWGGIVNADESTYFMDQSIDLATDMGALIVAAAGNSDQSNDQFRFYPARNPRTLSVGATEKTTMQRAEFSNYGKLVNVFAPGVSVTATGTDNEYIQASGTSLAAPLVAGVAALVKTRFPDLSPDALREKVRLSAINIDAQNTDLAGQLGRGYVNALAAVQQNDQPGIRLKEWSWQDDDADQMIDPGDLVSIKARFVNHLEDATDLTVDLISGQSYSFLDFFIDEVEVGFMERGEEIQLEFDFSVASETPLNQQVQLYIRVRDGDFEDIADRISFRVSRSMDVIHRSLSALYTATGGDQWTVNTNWDLTRIPSEEELDRWHGIIMSEGWLHTLNLSRNNLTQSFPTDLGGLAELRDFSAADNLLTGEIHREFGQLTNLNTLYLASNSLTGSIPRELGQLTKLKNLWLEVNSLSGPIPPELGNLSNLEWVDLFQNSLTGQLPASLGDLSSLKRFNFDENSLSGALPPELGNLSELEWASIRSNSLTGPIPSTFGNLARLEILDLGENSLSGSIPSTLGKLSNLEWLVLTENNLSGPIPTELGDLAKLELLDLGFNALTGVIPASVGEMSTLEELDLEENSLTGEIPSSFGNLSNLKVLNLVGNAFSGEVPAELGDLSGLEWLGLSGNDLRGSLPRSLMQLEGLKVFWFDGQALCAPKDNEFQAWLLAIPDVVGPTCGSLEFVSQIENQSYLLEKPIVPLILPEVNGGLTPITYSLTPTLPEGLEFDATTRTLGGTPTVVTPTPIVYTYGAIDSSGDKDSLLFEIEVFAGVALPDTVKDQKYLVSQPITPLILPQAATGTAPFTYTLTPQVPPGLVYDASNRTLSGTPSELTSPSSIEYTYKVMDARAMVDSLSFTITVYTAVYLFTNQIADQNYVRAQPIPPLVMAVAYGGIGPIQYSLTPALPVGLQFDASTRTLSGTPTVVTTTPVEYTYKASDSETSADSLQFKISVFSPISSEGENSLPEKFTVHGNYPNPFQSLTRVTFDLPWQARIRIEVMDVLGRQILIVPEQNITPGWSRSIEVTGASLPAGLYLYRLIADSPEGPKVKMGDFVIVQ